MKLFTSIILGGVLQVLAVSASRAAYINPDTANALDCFFWYVENGGLEVACVQTAAPNTYLYYIMIICLICE